MRCVVSTCLNDESSWSCTSQGITFHAFPIETSLLETWLLALNIEDWKPHNNGVICSNHFVKNDLYLDKNGQCRLRAGAVPIVNLQNMSNSDWKPAIDVKICRICFATHCKLYQMTMYKKLDRAYEVLTGLSVENEDNMPPYLCVECAQRLMNCVHFRTRSLRAHLVLLDIINKHERITLAHLESMSGNECLFRSSLSAKHYPPNYVNLEIKYMKSDNKEKTEINEQADIIDVINIEDTVARGIKSENSDTSGHVNEEVRTKSDTVYTPNVYVDVQRIKTENEDIFNQESLKDSTTNQYGTGDTGVTYMTPVSNVGSCSNYLGQQIDSEITESGTFTALSNAEKCRRYRLRKKMRARGYQTSANDVSYTPSTSNSQMMFAPSVLLVTIGEDPPLKEKSTLSNEAAVEHSSTNVDDTTAVPQSSNPEQINKSLKRSPKNTPKKDKLFCEICPYGTNSELRLLNHLKSHAKASFFICSRCEYKTNCENDLKAHSKMHSDEEKYPCHVCDRVFNLRNNLNRHMRIHSDEKPYSCDVCKKAFGRQDHYKGHLITHSNIKLYSCDICNKHFSRQDHYKSHLELHSQQKLFYACDVCEKLFNRKSNLKNHMKVHSGEKPHSCEVCGRTFSRNNNLRKHFKLHIKKPYCCDICKKCFKGKSKLKIHIQSHT